MPSRRSVSRRTPSILASSSRSSFVEVGEQPGDREAVLVVGLVHRQLAPFRHLYDRGPPVRGMGLPPDQAFFSSASTRAVTLRLVTPNSSLMLLMIWGPLQCKAPSKRILAYVIPRSCNRDLTHLRYKGPKAANSSTSRSDDSSTTASRPIASKIRPASIHHANSSHHILLLTYIVVNVNVYMYTIL